MEENQEHGNDQRPQPRVDGEIVEVQAPSSVDEGQTATISVTIKNTGNVDAAYRVQVGELSEETFLTEGASQTLTFDLTPGRSVNNIAVSLYDNEKRLDQQHVQLLVLYLSGEITQVEVPADVEEGQSAMAHVTIKNTGNKGGMLKVFLKGSNIYYAETWVAAGDSQTLSITFTAGRWDSNVGFSLYDGDTILDNTQQSIVVSHTVTLQITDNETSKAVVDMDVYVDGFLVGKTTQDGQVDVEVTPGRHKVSMYVPYVTDGMESTRAHWRAWTHRTVQAFENFVSKVNENIGAPANGCSQTLENAEISENAQVPENIEIEKYITVGEEDLISLTVDMPNPVFLAGMKVWTHQEWIFDQVGDVEVTLANAGEVSSQNTMAVLFVYFDDDLATPVATRVLNFGNIAPGASTTREVHDLTEFRNIKTERVVVVAFDGWRYTPNGEVIGGEVSVPMGPLAELVNSALDYLQQHPETIINAAVQIAGYII